MSFLINPRVQFILINLNVSEDVISDLILKDPFGDVYPAVSGNTGGFSFSYANSLENIREGMNRLESYLKDLK